MGWFATPADQPQKPAARGLRAAEQRRLDAEITTTDGMSGPDFERLVARLLVRDGVESLQGGRCWWA